MIEGSLIEGDKQIAPPDEVKLQMSKQQVDQVVASIRMCLDDHGRVSSLDSLKSTGFAAYDTRLTHEMSRWRYRPYEVNGRPVPVCRARRAPPASAPVRGEGPRAGPYPRPPGRRGRPAPEGRPGRRRPPPARPAADTRPCLDCPYYSCRSASIGSIEAARSAG